MSFDALIFDLDGTLWDCSEASARACNLAYVKFEIAKEVSREFIRSISGKPSNECDEMLLAGIPNSERQALLQCFDDYEISTIQKYGMDSLFAGVIEGLPRLNENYRLFLVSNCGERYLDAFLTHTSVGPLFSDSECFGRTRCAKADNIRSIITRNNVSRACYIGDTASDEYAAMKAKIPFFHAQYGFGSPVKKAEAFPDFRALTNYFMELHSEQVVRRERS